MQHQELCPPWIEFPHIPWGSVGWRMGFGEQHWLQWMSFYASLDELQKASYKLNWPESPTWLGFYAWVETRSTPPHILEEKARLETAALPPQEGEEVIKEPLERVQWLVHMYLKRPKIFIRDPYETREHILLADPGGWLWKLIIPTPAEAQPSLPYLVKAKDYVIGENNVEVKQPIT